MMDIKLYWKSIKNEIDAETWKSAKCYITEDKPEERSEAQASDDVLDINYCCRKVEQAIMQMFDLAHGKIKSAEKWGKVGNLNDVKNGDVLSLSDNGVNVEFVVDHKIGSAYYDAKGNGYVIDGRTCVFKCGYYKIEDGDVSDRLDNRVAWWSLRFGFNERQSMNAGALVARVHKYVVLYVLQEWSKISVPSMTKEYLERMGVEGLAISSMVHRKEEPDWEE